MVRNYGRMSPREIEQCHKGLMGGMSDSDRERVTRSAEARARIDYWSSQLERERDVVALISNRQNADNYVPDHAARRDRWQLCKAYWSCPLARIRFAYAEKFAASTMRHRQLRPIG